MEAVCLGRVWPCPHPRVQARCWHAARHPAPAYKRLAVAAPSPPAIRDDGCCYQHYDCSTGMFLLHKSPVVTCSASARCTDQRRNSQPSMLGSARQLLSAASTAVAVQRARSGSRAAFSAAPCFKAAREWSKETQSQDLGQEMSQQECRTLHCVMRVLRAARVPSRWERL